MPKRHGFAIFLAAMSLVLFAWLAWFAGREDYWADEGFSARRVEASWAQVYNPYSVSTPLDIDPFDTRFVFDLNPPLYFAMARSILGPHPSRVGLRMFSIAPAIMGLVLMGLWARRRCGERAAVVVTLAYVMSPAVLYYGHEARPYAMGMFFTLVVLMLYDRRPERAWILCVLNVVVTCAGLLTHFHTAWVFMTIGACYLIEAFWNRAKGWMRELAGAGGIALGALIALAVLWPARENFAFSKNSPSRIVDADAVIKTIFFPLVSQNVNRRVPFVLAAGAVVLFAGLIIYAAVKSKPCRMWLALWLVPSCAPMLVKLVFGMTFWERYAIFALPAFMMALGWVLREALNQSRVMRLAACAMIFFVFAGDLYWAKLHVRAPLRPPWKAAIASFYAVEKAGDYYTIEPEWHTLAFVANSPRHPKATYIPSLDYLPAGAKRLYIVQQVGGYQLSMQLAQAGWRVTAVGRDIAYWVWLAERS